MVELLSCTTGTAKIPSNLYRQFVIMVTLTKETVKGIMVLSATLTVANNKNPAYPC